MLASRAIAAYVLAGILVVIALPSAVFAAECTDEIRQTTGCAPDITAGIGDGSVDLGGSQTSPGSGSGGGSGAPAVPGDPDDECELIAMDRCMGFGPGRDEPAQQQPVTLSDIASFRPDPGIDTMEPDGWMVVGLDTNFVAVSGRHVKEGALLGQPASVRFTPVAWHWSYGDGASTSTSTPGATWSAQRLPEFSSTPTSHVYRAAGTYYIDLTIDYAAEYRFAGTGWTPISGTLNLPANRLVATAGGAKTVLVERECTRNPRGPGC